MEYLLGVFVAVLMATNSGLLVAYMKEKQKKTRVVEKLVMVKEPIDVAEITDGYVAVAKALGEALHGTTISPATRPDGFNMGDVGLDNDAGVRPGRWFPAVEFDESMGSVPNVDADGWQASDGVGIHPETVGEIP